MAPFLTSPFLSALQASVEWHSKVSPCHKSDLDDLVMDFLISEGYESVVEKFAPEANIQPPQSLGSMKSRRDIRLTICAGNIEKAIELINELDPEILENSPRLHFTLLNFQLIEMIRKCKSASEGDLESTLAFATTHLAPRAAKDPALLAELEETMALLCFPSDKLGSRLSKLMDKSLRLQVANQVNEAILLAEGGDNEARIWRLIRLHKWCEVNMAK